MRTATSNTAISEARKRLPSEGIAAELAGGRRTRIRAIEGFVPHGDAKALKQLLGFLPEQLADDLRGLEA